jgi:Rhodopirellula transposase DDE domain
LFDCYRMQDASAVERIRIKYLALSQVMDERMRRHWAATEAMVLGWGGISAVAVATGLARNTVATGVRELTDRDEQFDLTIGVGLRRPGGGRKRITEVDPQVLSALEELVNPVTRGHPESPLRWTCKSTAKLAEELTRQNHPVTDRTVARLLKQAGYSLQANRKTREGSSHPDRNAQFEYINKQVLAFQKRNQPVISVDTKKKELVGEFKNPGQEWQPKGKPEKVKVHDFPEKDKGKAIPYGVYDLASNEGWVSVGIDHDTAQFAAASIRRWWTEMGSQRFPRASKLLITADGGGSNSSRNRLWKKSLQELADELDLTLKVCHFPPGTSKWNKIEHRLFCFITKNWRGRPLTTYEVIVNLIASTTTKTGLFVRAAIDTNVYETGITVSDEELARLRVIHAKFHGEWNYTIKPDP